MHLEIIGRRTLICMTALAFFAAAYKLATWEPCAIGGGLWGWC